MMSLLQDAYPHYRQQRLRHHAAGRQSHDRAWLPLRHIKGSLRITHYFRMKTMVAWRSSTRRPITWLTITAPNGHAARGPNAD